ncbi:MAG: asparagine synthase (glutamine-hydrolyzing) [Betaproteobacteria bacterium]|nr:asparagine synthase (glutamine-hydrolyzing) [Betaproteobacteria bacterium]
MCGIAGFAGSGTQALTDRFVELLSHRGPDDHGTWFDDRERVGLSHTRLSIIDLSPAGHQPMWDDSGKVGIVFNGEIYNFRELRAELASAGYPFRSKSDTEVILAGYLSEGEDFVRRLNGIFAFAIWDGREKQLFVVRDPLGVKPLYYSESPEGLLFASEIKALVGAGRVDRSIDPEAIFAHLMFLWAPGSLTMLKSVRKLEAGHAMAVRSGKIIRHWRYYELPLSSGHAAISAGEAAERVSETLERAVERQMISDVPVGAFLSGGLDSSSIVHFARQRSSAPMPCFSIGFRDRRFEDEGFIDDLPYARKAAMHLGVPLHVVEVGPEIAYSVESMVRQLDEPQADPAAINVGLISKLAREHGIKVLLSGTGGDDLFTGYRRHAAMQAEKYWAWLPQSIRRLLSASVGLIPEAAPPSLRRVRRGLEYSHLDDFQRTVSYFFWMNPTRTEALLAPDLRQPFRAFRLRNPLTEALAGLPDDLPPLDQRFFLTDHNLNYTDKMGMAHGVEIRVPFLDLEVVRLAASLPLEMKQRGHIGKWILRKAMEHHLPKDIIYRPKTGFGAPVHSWLNDDLRPLLQDVLTEQAIRRRGLFDPAAVCALVEGTQASSVHGSYTLFALLCIELWCRSFIDQASPSR